MKGVIPLPLIHQIVSSSHIPLEARALIAFQYSAAARIGELLEYRHTDGTVSRGIQKSNIFVSDSLIKWVQPNFKSKKEKTKEVIVFKEEGVLFHVILDWLSHSGEQVFTLHQSRARELVQKFLRPYSSHALRHSRATHLAEIYDFNAYEIRDALGHTELGMSAHYVSTANRHKKMLDKLRNGGVPE